MLSRTAHKNVLPAAATARFRARVRSGGGGFDGGGSCLLDKTPQARGRRQLADGLLVVASRAITSAPGARTLRGGRGFETAGRMRTRAQDWKGIVQPYEPRRRGGRDTALST